MLNRKIIAVLSTAALALTATLGWQSSHKPLLNMTFNPDRAWDARFQEAQRFTRLANEQRASGKPLPAISNYRTALRLTDWYVARTGLAYTLVSTGQLDEARQILQKLVRQLRSGHAFVGSNDLSYALDLGDACTRTGLKEEATWAYSSITDHVDQIDAQLTLPDYDHLPAHLRTNALFAVGLSKLHGSQKAKQAVPLFQEIIRDRPTWGAARFMLAYSYVYAGDRENSRKAFTDAARFGFKRPPSIWLGKEAPNIGSN